MMIGALSILLLFENAAVRTQSDYLLEDEGPIQMLPD
jgi:hypothetical protein